MVIPQYKRKIYLKRTQMKVRASEDVGSILLKGISGALISLTSSLREKKKQTDQKIAVIIAGSCELTSCIP